MQSTKLTGEKVNFKHVNKGHQILIQSCSYNILISYDVTDGTLVRIHTDTHACTISDLHNLTSREIWILQRRMHTHTTITRTHIHTHTRLTCTCTCFTTTKIGYVAPILGVSQQKATRLHGGPAIGSVDSSLYSQFTGSPGAEIIYGLVRPTDGRGGLWP